MADKQKNVDYELNTDGCLNLIAAIINAEGNDYINTLIKLHELEKNIEQYPTYIETLKGRLKDSEDFLKSKYLWNMSNLSGNYLINNFRKMAKEKIEKKEQEALENKPKRKHVKKTGGVRRYTKKFDPIAE